MEDLIEAIEESWYKEPGATEEQLRQAESALGFPLPEDYKAFMRWSNGGGGRIGGTYLALWNIEDVREANESYGIDHYLPGVVGVGTDGGSQSYAFDYRAKNDMPSLIRVDLGDLDPESVIFVSHSFRAALERALRGERV